MSPVRVTRSLSFIALLTLLPMTTPGHAQDWQAGGGAAWETALEAARDEGEVIVAGPPQLATAMAEAFAEDTGIKLTYLGGSNRDIRTRFRREVAAGTVTIDVKLGGSGELVMIDGGGLAPIKPRLILPSVTDPENWIDGRIKWADEKEAYMPIPNEYVFGWPLVNADAAGGEQVTSWHDLLKPAFKGRIVSLDPRIPGPGQAAAAYLGDRFGESYLRRLFIDQQVTTVRDGRQLVEAVARGDFAVGLGAVTPEVEKFRRAGISTLQVPEMTDGPGSVLGGSAVPIIPADAPHPNAATVFVNWYMSARGQEIFAKIWRTPSRRIDVSRDGMPDYVVPKPDRAYLDQYQERWYSTMRGKWEAVLTELLGK